MKNQMSIVSNPVGILSKRCNICGKEYNFWYGPDSCCVRAGEVKVECIDCGEKVSIHDAVVKSYVPRAGIAYLCPECYKDENSYEEQVCRAEYLEDR
jgi:hypothetical protein